jgi:hypothetical protein
MQREVSNNIGHFFFNGYLTNYKLDKRGDSPDYYEIF